MTNAPYLLPKARARPCAWATARCIDHMFYDGLEDAYDKGRPDGQRSPRTARQSTASPREAAGRVRDHVARARAEGRTRRAGSPGRSRRSRSRPARTEASSRWTSSRSRPTSRRSRRSSPRSARTARSPRRTRASISDGAAALVLMRRSTRRSSAASRRSRPVDRPLHARAGAGRGSPPRPVGAIRKLFERTGWSAGDVDLYEINEAFAVVTMAAMKEHGLPHDKVNVPRRRLRARPSDRRLRRAHPGRR